MDQSEDRSSPNPADPERREFLRKAATVAVTGAAVFPPVVGGIIVALDPLRRSAAASDFVRVTSLDALPADGVPRKFTVFADRVDAWNKYAQTPVGVVYLRRTGEKEISALHSTCPHAGCAVDFLTDQGHFFCPCHESSFSLDGTVKSKSSPAARPLDSLDVEIRNESEVWVKFQNFLSGTSEKIPV
jgi:menaquinol-cytochrome c reductase iron-sulfur subunit